MAQRRLVEADLRSLGSAVVAITASVWLFAAPALAQSPAMDGRVVLAAEAATQAEELVQERLAEPGIQVVHLWAPWCGNSRAELEGPAAESAASLGIDAPLLRNWADLIEARPDVHFTFVTVYNNGEVASEALDGYGIDLNAPNFTLLAQPDFGPSRTRDLRRRTFLGLPVTWTPTTWIFRDRGQLAYAFNYGEVAMPELDAFLRAAADPWMHD